MRNETEVGIMSRCPRILGSCAAQRALFRNTPGIRIERRYAKAWTMGTDNLCMKAHMCVSVCVEGIIDHNRILIGFTCITLNAPWAQPLPHARIFPRVAAQSVQAHRVC